MAEKCRATSWRTAFCHPPEKRFLRGAAHSGVFAVRRLAFFAAFWSAVNRGLRPRKLMYFLTAKSTKNSPADAFAYFVPSNVRNGRLFAGLQANRPRFLPLLAGTSFHSFGIGPESFAAFRGGKDASGTNRKHRSLRSPLEAVLNRRILACSGERTTDSPRARSGRLHSLVLAAPAQRGPEVVPAKATCGWFWRYLLTPKGSYTPRQPPRFCLPDGQKAPTAPAVRTARRQAIRKKNLALRPACTIFAGKQTPAWAGCGSAMCKINLILPRLALSLSYGYYRFP
mgnify:CR=1 FL=1